MSYTFLWIALLVACLDWVAVARQWKVLKYFAKPGVMVAILIWLWNNQGLQGAMIPFAAGVFFSMLGDIFLMLPRERFIAGLVSFLLAHIAYLVGFNQTLPALNLPGLIMLLLVAVTGLQIYRRIAAGLQASGHQKLKLPVLVYSIAISLMLASALLTLTSQENSQTTAQEAWAVGTAILVSAGALLFYLSDTTLAWNRFVAPLPFGRLRVIVTYHVGQILIILGAALHFLPPVLISLL